MPLEAIAINSLDAPLIKKPARDNELAERLQALYDSDDAQPDGIEVLNIVEQGFKRGCSEIDADVIHNRSPHIKIGAALPPPWKS